MGQARGLGRPYAPNTPPRAQQTPVTREARAPAFLPRRPCRVLLPVQRRSPPSTTASTCTRSRLARAVSPHPPVRDSTVPAGSAPRRPHLRRHAVEAAVFSARWRDTSANSARGELRAGRTVYAPRPFTTRTSVLPPQAKTLRGPQAGHKTLLQRLRDEAIRYTWETYLRIHLLSSTPRMLARPTTNWSELPRPTTPPPTPPPKAERDPRSRSSRP